MHGNMHFIGSTQFVDVHTKLVHKAGFIMEMFGHRWARFTTIHPVTGEKAVHTFNEPHQLILYGIMIGMYRDNSDVVYTEDMRRIRRNPCQTCEGRGGAEDDFGNWVDCIVCEGEGEI